MWRLLGIGVVLVLGLACFSCASARDGRETGDGGGNGDLAGAGVDGGLGMSCDLTHPCPTGELCYLDHCIPDLGPCNRDDDCENDSYCQCAGGGGDMGPCTGGQCIPYGQPPRGAYDPSCTGIAFAATDFKDPIEKCHWPLVAGSTTDTDVIMTPLVGDLDHDGKPEIIFSTVGGRLVAIHGTDCTELFQKPAGITTFTQLAMADFDKDGFPEIVGLGGGMLTVFDHLGNVITSTSVTVGMCSGPAIADVDADGAPEILVDGYVFRFNKTAATLTQLFMKPATTAQWGNMSLFADLDNDGKPEVVTGLEVYDGLSGAVETPSIMASLGGSPGAYPAVSDFNMDGFPDLVLVQSYPMMQKLSIVDVKNNTILFGPYTVTGGGWGGTPTVGDYDGDGVPDVGFASASYYYVYALKCATVPKPVECTGTDPGVLWQRTTHDVSSGGTGSSTFDFNGDGVEEVVYRDECWMRVYNGKDGTTLFAQVISSGTCLEYPVIADVDNDGHADVVVPSDRLQGESCAGTPEGQTGQMWTQSTSGIFVLTDPMNRWVPSRPLWTSHTYHITEINDDLSVPTNETPSWKMTKSYRKNVQGGGGTGKMQADFTGHLSTVSCSNGLVLSAQICNRGTGPAAAPVSGSFYSTDPRMTTSMPICTAATTMTLMPGDCEAVSCAWPTPPTSPMDVWFRADDSGTLANEHIECHDGNDLLLIPDVSCPGIQ